MEIQFGEITSNDLNEIGKLQPEGWTDIVPEYELYVRNKFCFPKKAILDNEMVGVGTLIVFDSTAWLAHIIVDKNHRNNGIGFQITEKLINDGMDKSAEMGPIDPQVRVRERFSPAGSIIEQFDRAGEELKDDPSAV